MTATLDGVTRKKDRPEPSAEQKLAEELVARAREQGVSLTGPDGLLKQLTTRLYFPDEALNKADPVLGLVEDTARRQTLMAKPAGQEGGAKLYRFDIVLQGEGETVFFDV